MSTMEEWLRIQAERAQARVVTVNSGMAMTPVRFFSVARVTTSDVVSVITTTTVDGPAEPDPSLLEDRQRDLKEALYTSPLRNPVLLRMEERERQNKALWREADIFLSRLAKARTDRTILETDAATKIQTLFRGYRWRKFIAKERRKKKVRLRMRNRVKFMTKANNMVILEREKKARVLEQKRRAVRSIQCMARKYFAKRAAAKERQMLQEEVLIGLATRLQCMMRRRLARRAGKKARMRAWQLEILQAARKVQRVFRGHLGRRRAALRRFLLETLAATIVQRSFRRMIIVRSARKERYRRELEKMNEGSIGVQRLFRGKLGRRVAASVRDREENLLRHAGSLTIQRVYRGHMGRCIARDRRWRKHAAEEMRVATHFIRLWRGYMGRCIFEEEQERQEEDIFTQARRGEHDRVKDLLAGFGTDIVYTVKSMDAGGNTVLLTAARWGHKKIVRFSLRSGMQIDHVNDDGRSAVELAVLHSHPGVAEYLISKGASLSFFDRTLLHEAAKRGMVTTVQALIASNVPINEKDPSGLTALHEAVANDQFDAMVVLLDRGADIAAVDKRGRTPLHAAAAGGHARCVQYLVDNGADATVVDNERRTAWRVALTNKHEAAAKILRAVWAEAMGDEVNLIAEAEATQDDKDAVFEHAVHGRYEGVESILERGLPVDFADMNGTTILMAAAAANAADIVTLCIRKGANVKHANNDGRTALHTAAEHQAVCELLMKHGAEAGVLDSNDRSPLHEAAAHGWVMQEAVQREGLDVNMVDAFGVSPLMDAARGAQPKAVQQLLKMRARVNAKDSSGQTALHHGAAAAGAARCLELLMGRGAGVNHTDEKGRTALHAAAEKGYLDNITALLEGGASAAITDTENKTAARLAVDGNFTKCLTMIMQYGGSATDADPNSHTPLYVALAKGNVEAVTVLLKHGGDVMETYSDGWTPLHVAAAYGHHECARAILDTTEMKQFLVDKTDLRGETPFMAGCRSGRGGGLKEMLAAGATIPEFALNIAAAAPKKAAVEFLVFQGVDVDKKDGEGLTALHRAAKNGRVANMRLLLQAGADETEVTEHGHTALDLCSTNGQDAAAEFLIGDREVTGESEEGDSDVEDTTAGYTRDEIETHFAV